MVLEGTVTNVTNFGAFVDIGVHQDGLVHISAMSEQYIKDPREVVKSGDLIRVKVLEVELERKRIALTMRLAAPAAHVHERTEVKRAEANKTFAKPAMQTPDTAPTGHVHKKNNTTRHTTANTPSTGTKRTDVRSVANNQQPVSENGVWGVPTSHNLDPVDKASSRPKNNKHRSKSHTPSQESRTTASPLSGAMAEAWARALGKTS